MSPSQVMGLHTPAGNGGLQAGDVLIEVGGRSVVYLTHAQVRYAIYPVKLRGATQTPSTPWNSVEKQ